MVDHTNSEVSMDQNFQKNRNSKKNKKPFGQQTKVAKAKTKKKGRQRLSAISGFSTLSQVSGAPLTRSFHSSIPVAVPLSVSEPHPVCAICAKPIDLIADSFFYNGGYAHFDCVLSALKEKETLGEGDTISYVGSGSFAICHKDENGKYSIVKKIEVENKDEYSHFKDYVESLKK